MTAFRSFLFISIVYFTGQCNRAILCAKGDNTLLFVNENSDSQSIDVIDKETKVIRASRELQNIDVETDSNNLTDEERSARCLLGNRQHLKKNDADRVAKYFLNGGPLTGNSHFDGLSNEPCATNNNEQNDIVGQSNPTNEDYKQPSTKENNLNAQYHNSFVGIPHTPALYTIPGSIPHISPYIPGYAPIVGKLNSYMRHPHLKPRIRGRHGLLGSILHSHLHPYIHEFRNIPHTLLQSVATPMRNILHGSPLNYWNAPSSYYRPNENIMGTANMIPQGTSSKSSYPVDLNDPNEKGSTTTDESDTAKLSPINGAESHDNNGRTSMQGLYPMASEPIPIHQQLAAYPQPTGYMVRVVPHYGQNVPTSPYVGNSGIPYHRSFYGAPIVGATRSNTDQEIESTTVQNETESTNDSQSTQTTKKSEKKCKVSKREDTLREEIIDK